MRKDNFEKAKAQVHRIYPDPHFKVVNDDQLVDEEDKLNKWATLRVEGLPMYFMSLMSP